jgi:hypothetical protein
MSTLTRASLIKLAVAATGSLLLAGCPLVPPAGSPAAMTNTPALTPGAKLAQVEPSSAVMPPGANNSCPDGRVFLSYGNGYNATRMYSTNIACVLSGQSCFTIQGDGELNAETFQMTSIGQSTDPTFNCNTTLATVDKPLQTVQRHNSWYTDSQIIRVGKTDLINAFLVRTYHAPAHPVSAINDPGGPSNPQLPLSCANYFTTSSLVVSKSTDCGNTWKKVWSFDINDPAVQNGAWALPEWTNGNSNTRRYVVDRHEIYADPFAPLMAQQVFLTTTIRPGPIGGSALLFRSLDGGSSWLSPVILPGANLGDNGIPTVVTTTTNTRLYVFHCEGPTPMLYWSDDYGETFKPKSGGKVVGLNVAFIDGKGNPMACNTAGANVLGNAPGLGAGSNGISIARWGNPTLDNVIITYSALNGSFQVQPVVTLLTHGKLDDSPSVNNNIIIDKSASNQSVLQGTFVPTDRLEFHPDENNDPLFDAVAFEYLIVNSPAAGGTSTMKFQLVRRGLLWQGEQQLSFNNGAADVWQWNNPGPKPLFFGDYTRGAFIYANLSGNMGAKPALQFFVPWIEATPGAAGVLAHGSFLTWPEP